VSADRVTVAGGILAGGEGRRFGGKDKGWLEVDGRPLVEPLLASLSAQVDRCLISANRNLERYAALGVPVVPDKGGAGPLAGIATLLEAAEADWLIVVPVDTLALPTDWVLRFLEVAKQGAEIVALHDGHREHPTFSAMSTQLAESARAQIDRGDWSLLRWMSLHRLDWLRLPAPPNLNSPEDLHRLRHHP